ncbi:MAG TPA: arylsulfotransferase family protein [Solirubrobacteraceae bacterium]
MGAIHPGIRAGVLGYAIAALLIASAMAVGAPAARALTISPLDGTPDASPHTQISFLGVAAGEIHDVTIAGSRSGSHGGRLEAYASSPGASFLPFRGFGEGERVSVSALVGSAHHERRVGSVFTVARLARYLFTPTGSAPAARPGTVQRFASQPGLTPPSVRVTDRSPGSSLDDVFITANHGYGQWGPMIFDRAGALVWFKPVPKGETAMDLQVQSYRGEPVLVWWQGYVANLGIGFGTDEIYSSAYRPVALVRAGNGYWADLHDIQITSKGAAFITAYSLVESDLSSVGGAREGALQDALVQEVDVRTGLVMFEWHADGHVAVDDSYSRGPISPAIPWDYFHVNSISLDPSNDGNFLISSRNTWAGYEIDGHTGQILWRLGGRHSSFRMGPGTGTAWQHDIRWQPDGTITLFDDGAVPDVHSQSRAIRERIDWAHRTVHLAGREVRAQSLLTGSQGNDQALPGGGSFVGWGERPYFTEFGPSGQTVFEANIPYPGGSYRAYTYPWTATPATPPALSVTSTGAEASMVYASWNGATGVSGWRVLAGADPAHLSVIATAARTGFETAIPVHSLQPDFAVQALGASGQTLAISHVISR